MPSWSAGSERESTAVFGYVRQNYKHNVPEVLMAFVVRYFSRYYHLKWQGKEIQKLLSPKNAIYYAYNIRFNKNITYLLNISPNTCTGSFDIGLSLKNIPDDVDNICICWEQKINTFTYDQSIKRVTRFDRNNLNMVHIGSMGQLSQFEQLDSLITTHIIHALQIKYKSNNNTLYYPSLKANQLNQVWRYKWKVDKMLIDEFKDWPNKAEWNSPLCDNGFIRCYPNGYDMKSKGTFEVYLVSVMVPMNVKRMKLECKVTTNMDQIKKVECYHKEFELSTKRVGFEVKCTDNFFVMERVRDELILEAEMVIQELYDLNDNVIPKERWIHHNVTVTKSN